MLISQHSSKYLRRPSDLGVLLSFPVAMASGRVFYLKKKKPKQRTKQNMCVRLHACESAHMLAGTGRSEDRLGCPPLISYLNWGTVSPLLFTAMHARIAGLQAKGFSYCERGILDFWIGFWTKNVLSFATEDISEASSETWIQPAALVTKGTHTVWCSLPEHPTPTPVRHKLYPNTYFHREILY